MAATTVLTFSSQAGLATFTTAASSPRRDVCPRRAIDSSVCALTQGHLGRCIDSAGTQVWGPAHVTGAVR